MIINICKSIQCPYFGEGRHYGCQRYAFSCGCHLWVIQEFPSTEYILFAQESQPINLKALKSENDRFFLEDPKYKDDLKFQASHADWFNSRTPQFQAKEISN